MKQFADCIGIHVRYFDYLGLERFGTVVWEEPYPYDSEVRYLYISDEEPEFNFHRDIVSNGQEVQYAEIRLSTEVSIDIRE